ncbi:hypothetical protein H0H81_003126 [Sphagnurus paluster]|uniref:Protein kinase domain-containing protein n=1 Tax=Sphagnurus paluster TaxID=117069 RepID=A0A9P7FQ34_9AGAR|nr:hypothetical protein H0H81_003126 [Sphagnurus paluster]
MPTKTSPPGNVPQTTKRPQPRPKKSASWFSLCCTSAKQFDDDDHVPPQTQPVAIRLQSIMDRLIQIFKNAELDKHLYRSRGRDAQDLLDTFQLILTFGPPEDSRRSFILASQKLTSLSGLYPSQFILKDVMPYDELPVASGTHADIRRGIFQGREVCLKTIRVYQTSIYDNILKTIAREAIFWGQLAHPNLLPFYGVYTLGRQMSLVFPWAVNGNVVEFLKVQPSANRLLLCADIAGGLAHLHQNNFIYGCLKGSNVLIDRSHRAYLGDFGISAVVDPEILSWAAQSVTTSTGSVLRWLAPELFEVNTQLGEESPHNTRESDVYAWACVCYEIFAERVPFFEDPRDHAVIMKVSKGARPSKPNYAAALTDEIWALMNKCWERQPSQRPSSALVLSKLIAMQPRDNRPPGEWMHQMLSQNKTDVPLDLNRLNKFVAPKYNSI